MFSDWLLVTVKKSSLVKKARVEILSVFTFINDKKLANEHTRIYRVIVKCSGHSVINKLLKEIQLHDGLLNGSYWYLMDH